VMPKTGRGYLSGWRRSGFVALGREPDGTRRVAVETFPGNGGGAEALRRDQRPWSVYGGAEGAERKDDKRGGRLQMWSAGTGTRSHQKKRGFGEWLGRGQKKIGETREGLDPQTAMGLVTHNATERSQDSKKSKWMLVRAMAKIPVKQHLAWREGACPANMRNVLT